MEIVESKCFCRKCKSKDLMITEVWTGSTIVWEQMDGKFDMSDGTLHPDGDPYKVEAKCKKCKHRWKIRKINQITGIIK